MALLAAKKTMEIKKKNIYILFRLEKIPQQYLTVLNAVLLLSYSFLNAFILLLELKNGGSGSRALLISPHLHSTQHTHSIHHLLNKSPRTTKPQF
jgi:hypothetical protein